jgi:hypothetical protein
VFVTTEAPEEGLADLAYRQRMDSTADVIGAFRTKKGIAVVDSAGNADVTVEILGRERAPKGEPTPGSRGANNPKPREGTERRLRALMRAGDVEKEFWAGGGIVWRKLAGQIAKDVDLWIIQNRATLLAKRPG